MIDSYIKTTHFSGDLYSKKHLFRTTHDNVTFECSSFFRPSLNRYDLCISSTAGCSLGCKICQCSYSAIDHERYERTLTSTEIIDQIEFLIEDGRNFLRNDTMVLVGFMGNGDPFNNTEQVLGAIKMAHKKFSKLIYRYGVSTVGINLDSVSLLSDLTLQEDITVWLQFSLVTMDDDKRRDILPKSPSLLQAIPILDLYASKTGTPIRYNFPMIQGLNDALAHLDKIIRFINERPESRMVKLSTYNEISNKEFLPCADIVIENSAHYLRQHGVRVDEFYGNRDKKLRGSCGQLRELPF